MPKRKPSKVLDVPRKNKPAPVLPPKPTKRAS